MPTEDSSTAVSSVHPSHLVWCVVCALATPPSSISYSEQRWSVTPETQPTYRTQSLWHSGGGRARFWRVPTGCTPLFRDAAATPPALPGGLDTRKRMPRALVPSLTTCREGGCLVLGTLLCGPPTLLSPRTTLACGLNSELWLNQKLRFFRSHLATFSSDDATRVNGNERKLFSKTFRTNVPRVKVSRGLVTTDIFIHSSFSPPCPLPLFSRTDTTYVCPPPPSSSSSIAGVLAGLRTSTRPFHPPLLQCQYGKIIECRTLVDPKTTISRCTAFVQFDTRREAKDALKFMNGHVLPGAKKGLLVKFAEDHHRRVQRQEQGHVRERTKSAGKGIYHHPYVTQDITPPGPDRFSQLDYSTSRRQGGAEIERCAFREDVDETFGVATPLTVELSSFENRSRW